MKAKRFLLAVFMAVLPSLWVHPAGADEQKRVRVVASFYPMYVMALNVAGGIEGVSVSNLTPPVSGCLHDYALTTEEMKKLSGADILIVNGAGMETFVSRVAGQFPGLKLISLSEGIPLIEGEGSGGANPHVWVSVAGAIAQVRNLAAGFAAFDPPRAAAYERNAAGYIRRLEALRGRMQQELAPYMGKKIITFHEAFPYFAREFGLELAAVVEREPGSAPSAKELSGTIDLIRASGIAALFSEPQYPAAAAEAIARETGARVYTLDPAVTGPDDPDAYLRTMEGNLRVLKEALAR